MNEILWRNFLLFLLINFWNLPNFQRVYFAVFLLRINPLTQELNHSVQRCMTISFTGDFASWTVHFFNICVKNQQIHLIFIQFINYAWSLLHVSSLHCHFQGASSDVVREVHHVTRHNTPIHNILSTVPQLSISQKAIRTLPEDGNVMSKHIGATIHN
jgi:hypothetical protein